MAARTERRARGEARAARYSHEAFVAGWARLTWAGPDVASDDA